MQRMMIMLAFTLVAVVAIAPAIGLVLGQGSFPYSANLPLVIKPAGGEPPSPTPQASPTSTSTPDTSGYRDEVIRLLAIERQNAGCDTPLLKNTALMDGAQAWSEYLLVDNSQPHSPLGWYQNFGYPGFPGENIAFGSVTPEMVIQGWMDSPDHRRTMLDCSFPDGIYLVGVGYVVPVGGEGGVWTLALGVE